MARRFGLGSIVGLNPMEEQAGRYTEEALQVRLRLISIGQGDIPSLAAGGCDDRYIANNGFKKPYVVKDWLTVRQKNCRGTAGPKIISPFVAMEIRKMMEMVVDDGTGTMAALPGFGGAAGKTSSAQTGQRMNGREVLHAWFTGYVPRLYPKYVITVLVENGRSGGGVAAPVFRDIARRIMELGER